MLLLTQTVHAQPFGHLNSNCVSLFGVNYGLLFSFIVVFVVALLHIGWRGMYVCSALIPLPHCLNERALTELYEVVMMLRSRIRIAFSSRELIRLLGGVSRSNAMLCNYLHVLAPYPFATIAVALLACFLRSCSIGFWRGSFLLSCCSRDGFKRVLLRLDRRLRMFFYLRRQRRLATDIPSIWPKLRLPPFSMKSNINPKDRAKIEPEH